MLQRKPTIYYRLPAIRHREMLSEHWEGEEVWVRWEAEVLAQTHTELEYWPAVEPLCTQWTTAFHTVTLWLSRPPEPTSEPACTIDGQQCKDTVSEWYQSRGTAAGRAIWTCCGNWKGDSAFSSLGWTICDHSELFSPVTETSLVSTAWQGIQAWDHHVRRSGRGGLRWDISSPMLQRGWVTLFLCCK